MCRGLYPLLDALAGMCKGIGAPGHRGAMCVCSSALTLVLAVGAVVTTTWGAWQVAYPKDAEMASGHNLTASQAPEDEVLSAIAVCPAHHASCS